MKDERRQFERYPVRATVFARSVSEEEYHHLLHGGGGDPMVPSVASLESMSGGYRATSYDISEGGLGLDGDLQISGGGSLRKGECLVLALDIEGHTGRIRALGRVVWSVLKAGRFRAGVAFAVIADRDLEALREALRVSGG